MLVGHGDAALYQREGGESNCDHQRNRDQGTHSALPERRCAPAGEHEGALLRRRGRFLARLTQEPLLGCIKLRAGNEETAISPVLLPLGCFLPPLGVLMHPVQIGLYAALQRVEGCVEIVGKQADLRHPVMGGQRLWQRPHMAVGQVDWDNPLVEAGCVVQLSGALFRRDRIGADHEHERVGGADGLLEFIVPPGCRWKVFDIDPYLHAAFREGDAEAFGEREVTARIGDENVSHGFRPCGCSVPTSYQPC